MCVCVCVCVCERRVFTKKLQLNGTLKLSVRTLTYRRSYTSGHSYKIYETSLQRISYEITTSVRFCLSCDISEWDFIDYEMNIISKGKRIIDMEVVNDVTCTSQKLLHVWSYDLSDIY